MYPFPTVFISAIKPVPDTTGTSFLFTIPYCLEDEPTSMYVVSQTTEAVNLTLTSQGSQLQFNVPSLGALRHNISCEDLLVNNTSKTGKLLQNCLFVGDDFDAFSEKNIYIYLLVMITQKC